MTRYRPWRPEKSAANAGESACGAVNFGHHAAERRLKKSPDRFERSGEGVGD
jgi:hypothetical protein